MKKLLLAPGILSALIIVVPLVSAQPTQAPAPNKKQGPASNTITLDIKGMDIVDVLKMFSARFDMNIVVGKNVTGRVTLFLKDVDVWDAFELVLSSNDLAYEKKGDIINVMTQRDYELEYGERYQDKKQAEIIRLKFAKAEDVARSLNLIKTTLGKVIVDDTSNTIALIDTPEKIADMQDFIARTDIPLETKIFDLNYATAEKLSPKLLEIVTKGLGTVRIDERTNKVVVTDYPDKLREIEKIIAAFDERTPQVLIDAQIIQITPSDLYQMGVDWNFWIDKNFDLRAALPVGTANRLFIGTTAAAPAGRGDFKSVIDLLRTIGDTKVLSSPRIMALNNQEAKIHVGTKDAYITSTTSQAGTGTAITSQSVNFVDVGIQLRVTPTINKDGFVTMKIKPEVSDASRTDITSENQITQVPIVSTSEAETTVAVKDGVTIIIGGLSKDKRDKTVKKIPFLGDIPFLGALFRSASDNLTKSDLIILLTPHIFTGEKSFTEVSQLKPQDGVVVNMVNGDIVNERILTGVSKPVISQPAARINYPELIINKIKNASLVNPPKGEKGKVEISFILAKDGTLKGEPMVLSSSNPNLNNIAIESIKRVAPFAPFSDSSAQNELTFTTTLAYE